MASPYNPIRILIVEGDPVDTVAAKRMLAAKSEACFEVDSASTLADALAVLDQECPRVVLLEVDLPDSRGLDTVHKVLAHRTHPVCIVVTDWDSEDAARQAIALGVQDYLVKGLFDAKALTRSVRHAVERKRVEEQVRASEEAYRHLVEDIHEVIYALDGNGVITYASPVAEDVFGYSPSELVGQAYASLIYPEDLPRVLQAFQEVMNNRVSPCEFRVRMKTGDIRWVRTSGRPITAEGRTVGLRGVLTDITERRRTEEELQNLASVVRHSSELINLATLDGRMTFLNEAGAEMLGIAPEEVAQTHILQVMSDSFRDRAQEEVLPALKEHGRWEGDLQYRNLRTGALIDVHAMTFLVMDQATGSPLYLANVSADITARKRAEEALRWAKEQAEASIRQLEQANL